MATNTDEDRVTSPDLEAYGSMSASESDLIRVPQGYRQEEAGDLFQITRDQYITNRDANTRGTANPSTMNNPFWLFQVGPKGLNSWEARTVFGNEEDPLADSEDPVWCFNRFGGTRTKLPDGRLVCIGGEHEDNYDPDFCIYNDVIVFDAPEKTNPPPLLTPDCIKIYGYPVEVFPPTDFHTSTFYADPMTGKGFIFIIGGLGYAGQASRNRTEIFRLDLGDFSLHRIDASGAGPSGGTFRHKAELVNEDGQPSIRLMAETEESEEPNTIATANDEDSMTADSDEQPRMMTRDGKELVTREESKVFTLRIQDMTWI